MGAVYIVGIAVLTVLYYLAVTYTGGVAYLAFAWTIPALSALLIYVAFARIVHGLGAPWWIFLLFLFPVLIGVSSTALAFLKVSLALMWPLAMIGPAAALWALSSHIAKLRTGTRS